MKTSNHIAASNQVLTAILRGGSVAGVLDALNGVIAYGFLGLNPIQVLQFIASGALGGAAFHGGLPAAALGAFFHFVIAFAVAGIFTLGARALRLPARRAIPAGLVFGALVFLIMNYAVLPFTAVAPSPFSLPLFLNGVIGHALLVGVPIAWFARRVLPD
jgi:hypothetical protein